MPAGRARPAEPAVRPETTSPSPGSGHNSMAQLDKILFVDDTPPYRREIVPDSAQEAWSPRTYLGRSRDQCQRDLARLGIKTAVEDFELPADADHLSKFFNEETPTASKFTPGTDITIVATRPASAQTIAFPIPVEAEAGRVIAFREEGRKSITTATSRITVQLYEAGSKTEVSPSSPPRPPAPAQQTQLQFPARGGGWFTLQATLKNLDPAVASPSYNALFHARAPRSKVWDVGTLTSATPTVETTLKVPDDPGNLPSLSEIRVTVLVRETGEL